MLIFQIDFLPKKCEFENSILMQERIDFVSVIIHYGTHFAFYSKQTSKNQHLQFTECVAFPFVFIYACWEYQIIKLAFASSTYYYV